MLVAPACLGTATQSHRSGAASEVLAVEAKLGWAVCAMAGHEEGLGSPSEALLCSGNGPDVPSQNKFPADPFSILRRGDLEPRRPGITGCGCLEQATHVCPYLQLVGQQRRACNPGCLLLSSRWLSCR